MCEDTQSTGRPAWAAWPLKDVLSRLRIMSTSMPRPPTDKLTDVLGKTNGQWRIDNFLFEDVFLVEKQYNGCVREPLIVAYRIE